MAMNECGLIKFNQLLPLEPVSKRFFVWQMFDRSFTHLFLLPV